MSSNPYENEPGFETAHDEGDKKNQKDYVAKVCSTLFSVLDLY
jgi:ubiquitin-conjugating enzyme E2 Z